MAPEVRGHGRLNQSTGLMANSPGFGTDSVPPAMPLPPTKGA